MRVLYVTSSLPAGPGEAFLIPEIIELQRQGHVVKVVPLYPRGQLVHRESNDIAKHALMHPLISYEIVNAAIREFLRTPRKALQALWLLVTCHPRHLVKNLGVYPKGLWLAGVARRWRAEHIHVHWAATTASMAMVASHVSGVPWSLTAHRWDVVENNLLRRKAVHASFFRCISEKTKAMALERGVPEERVRVLHLGVSFPVLSEDASKGVRPSRETFVMLCPAAFLPVKGHRFLIEALVELPEHVQLWLAGDGPLRPELESQVQRLGLRERVRFLGYLPHDQLLSLYRDNQVDAVVLPSVDLGDGLNEGIPVALMEAMAFGYPVIATATGGIPELLRDGAGLLVPDKSSRALAEAISQLLTDETLREELARRGRQRVEREFSVGEVVKALINLWGDASA